MFWGKKEDELPEALRGKTPEQIAQALADAEKVKNDLATLTAGKTELETQFNTQKSEFEQMKAKIAELETSATKPPDKKPDEEPPSIWTDPDKYIADKIKGTENTAMLSGMLTAKMYAQNGLSARDRKIWTKYEKEVDATMNGFAPQQRILPQSWLMALTLVKGQHDVEIAKAEQTSTDFFSEGTSHSQPNEIKVEDKLTPDEEEACRTFKWDPKRYLAQKKKMQVSQSEKGGYAHFGV